MLTDHSKGHLDLAASKWRQVQGLQYVSLVCMEKKRCSYFVYDIQCTEQVHMFEANGGICIACHQMWQIKAKHI